MQRKIALVMIMWLLPSVLSHRSPLWPQRATCWLFQQDEAIGYTSNGWMTDKHSLRPPSLCQNPLHPNKTITTSKIDCHHHESNQRLPIHTVQITTINIKFKLLTNFHKARKKEDQWKPIVYWFPSQTRKSTQYKLQLALIRQPHLQHLA